MRLTAIAICLTLATVPATAETTFTATLNGSSNVPPIPEVTATGTGTFTLNDAHTELAYHIEYSGLSSPEIGAHIHVGNARENGPIAFALGVGSPKDGVWIIPPEHAENLLAGKLYVNIHTDTYVSGEIRGNIIQSDVPTETVSWGRLKALYHMY